MTEEQLSNIDFHTRSAKCALYGRDIINTRGSEADPDFMEERIRELIDGQKHISEVTVIKGEQLQKEGMGLFYGKYFNF